MKEVSDLMITLRSAGIRLLAVGLLLSFAVPASAATPDKLLPADSDVVIQVNVKPLLDSGVVKKHALEEIKTAIKDNAKAGEILRQLNFDPLKDVTAVTMSMSLSNAKQPDFLGILRGTFDVDKIHAELAKHTDKVASSEYGSLKVYENKEAGQSGYVSVLDKGTVVVSNKKTYVHNAIDHAKASGASNLKKELQSALEQTDDKQTIWMAVGMTDTLKKLAQAAGQGAPGIEALEGMTLGLVVKDDVSLEFNLLARNADEAKQMAPLLEQGLDQGKAMVPFLTRGDKALADVITDILATTKVSADGKKVKTRSNISSENVEKLVKKAKEARPR